MRIILLILVIIGFTSCNSNENRFDEYVKTLDKLSLPEEFDLNSGMNASANYDSLLFEKYKHVWTYRPYGIAYSTDKFIGIIEYSIADNGLAPFLVTYSLTGNKIDSLNILGNTGFGEYGETLESAILKKDFTISVTDTTRHWKNDNNYEPIQSSIHTSIKISDYKIGTNGKIREIKVITKTLVSPKIEETKLTGLYEYIYKHNTDDLIENHYLEFRKNETLYYGTSDDFDEAREGYLSGFFFTKINNLSLTNNQLDFSLTINDSDFFQNPITPLFRVEENKPWEIGIRYDTRKYEGQISGDTITIITTDFDPRKFIKMKK